MIPLLLSKKIRCHGREVTRTGATGAAFFAAFPPIFEKNAEGGDAKTAAPRNTFAEEKRRAPAK